MNNNIKRGKVGKLWAYVNNSFAKGHEDCPKPLLENLGLIQGKIRTNTSQNVHKKINNIINSIVIMSINLWL